MIFTHLTIENFGVYAGTHEFDLRPRRINDHFLPVILFGGKNGAGKTTIMKLYGCLYGQLALGSRVRRVNYETYVIQRLHRGWALRSLRSARIGLIFDHIHAGVLSTYDTVRAWRVEGQTLHESVSIYKNGQMRDIAPTLERFAGISRRCETDLFFFDGSRSGARR